MQKPNLSFVRGDKTINKRPNEQTLHLDTSQLALNQDPTVCWGYLLELRHEETWGEQCECFVTQRLFLVCSGEKDCV